MNGIERYFHKFGYLADEMEDVPATTEAEFLDRLHGRASVWLKHTKALTFILSGIAAAVIVIGLGWSVTVHRTENAAQLCAEGYVEGMESLLKEVCDLELNSWRCREMDISSVIREQIASSEGFAESIDGLDDRQSIDIVREYCDRQMRRVRELYRKCVLAYESGNEPIDI
mgnify:CR=1 FL=1